MQKCYFPFNAILTNTILTNINDCLQKIYHQAFQLVFINHVLIRFQSTDRAIKIGFVFTYLHNLYHKMPKREILYGLSNLKQLFSYSYEVIFHFHIW